jgi:hypothetical protein
VIFDLANSLKRKNQVNFKATKLFVTSYFAAEKKIAFRIKKKWRF